MHRLGPGFHPLKGTVVVAGRFTGLGPPQALHALLLVRVVGRVLP
jgi:hypothetical protein